MGTKSPMAEVRKELSVRTRVSSIYNKKEADFPDKRAYDDYLEEVEDIIYKLTYNIDVLETEERVRDYERTQAQKAAAATAAKPAEAAAGYAPAMAGGTAMPTVVTQVTQDAEGRLVHTKGMMDRAQIAAAAAAGGWNPDIARRRAEQDAFATIFVC